MTEKTDKRGTETAAVPLKTVRGLTAAAETKKAAASSFRETEISITAAGKGPDQESIHKEDPDRIKRIRAPISSLIRDPITAAIHRLLPGTAGRSRQTEVMKRQKHE